MSAPWGWSSRKQQCVGTSPACFKSLKKKLKKNNHDFLFQVIPAGRHGGFFCFFGGSPSLTAGTIGQWAPGRQCAIGSWITSLVKFSNM